MFHRIKDTVRDKERDRVQLSYKKQPILFKLQAIFFTHNFNSIQYFLAGIYKNTTYPLFGANPPGRDKIDTPTELRNLCDNVWHFMFIKGNCHELLHHRTCQFKNWWI